MLPTTSDIVVKILVSTVLGGLVGIERVWTEHPAGFRTNILIAVSSCIFTILSISVFPLMGDGTSTSQVAAQIVTGVGFLGAGAIFHAKNSTIGFTTAASIWLVAAVGMSVGVGQYFLALFSTILAVVVLAALAPVSDWLEEKAKERHGLKIAGLKNQEKKE